MYVESPKGKYRLRCAISGIRRNVMRSVPSGMLCSVHWEFVTDGSGQIFDRVFKCQAVREEIFILDFLNHVNRVNGLSQAEKSWKFSWIICSRATTTQSMKISSPFSAVCDIGWKKLLSLRTTKNYILFLGYSFSSNNVVKTKTKINTPLPPGRHDTKSCTRATNMCGSSVWTLFIVTLLAPSIFECPLEFLHIFAPLNEIIFYRRLDLVSFVSSESACRMSGEITSAICEMLNLLQE